MYIPNSFAERDLPAIFAFIEAHPLATLVTSASGEGLLATHLPLVLNRSAGPMGTLVGHFARANPHSRSAAGDAVDALVIFSGPDAYITPSWYPTKQETGRVVPTWNYAVVHAYGMLQVRDDPKFLRTHLEVLTLQQESAQSCPWHVSDAPADYIAQQMQLPLVVARLDSLVSSLLGNTAKNIRKIFEFASRQPCILFLDEFDAIAKARDDQHELGELKRVVNSLLQNIDEFVESNILIAATNHQELLDKAIWRRFNSIIDVSLPQSSDIQRLLQLFLKSVEFGFDLDSKKGEALAELMQGNSPADIKSICQNAIAQNVLAKKPKLDYEDLLLQFYYYKHHEAASQEALLGFLNTHGVSQAAIADLLDISLRQVRNYFNPKA